MLSRYTLALLAVIFSAVFFCEFSIAKEDTAQITLKKTATSKQNPYTYTVKKGDVISIIIRRIPNITEEDMQDNYKIIKDLNPDISDVNKLYVGQLLVLPGKPLYEIQQNKMESNTDDSFTAPVPPLTNPAGGNTYAIKKGDTLFNIIRRELKVTETNIPKTVKIIKSINPNITNVNKIYPGTIIKLPGKTVFVKTPEETKAVEQTAIKPSEKTTQPEKIIEIKEKIVMSPEARLAVLKHVITQMNGSISTTGNYYLPVPKAGQVTIDCSKIPVIEFDDNTTVFLDLENRANNNLKKIISDNWANYYLVKAGRNDDVIAILKKVINTTKRYSMTKSEKPLMIGAVPPVEVIVDWVIVNTLDKQAQPLTQGIRLIYENNLLLPKSIKNYSQKNGLIITEISEETGIVGKPEEVYSLPPIPVFPTTSAKDFSYALISYLGFKADKDAEVKVFDITKDGFNLSIKADVLVKSANKRYIIYSRNLPTQFVNALRKAGHEVLFIAENDSPKIIMEKILPSFNITFASGFFTFSGIDKNHAPYILSFQGTKIKADNNLYIIDFEIDQGLRSLLREVWGANIARY